MPPRAMQLWGSIEKNAIVGNIEGEMVAYCTTPNHGTRVIPPGALKGVQLCVPITVHGYFR